MRLIDRGQQLDVGPCVEFGEAPPPVDGWLHSAAGRVAADQPRHLRPAHPGHLFDVAPNQAPRRLALLAILLLEK